MYKPNGIIATTQRVITINKPWAPRKNCVKLCRLTRTLGGDFVWEWPERCDFWNGWRVVASTKNPFAFATTASSAVDWHDFVGDRQVYIETIVKVLSTDPAVTEMISPFHMDSTADSKTFM